MKLINITRNEIMDISHYVIGKENLTFTPTEYKDIYNLLYDIRNSILNLKLDGGISYTSGIATPFDFYIIDNDIVIYTSMCEYLNNNGNDVTFEFKVIYESNLENYKNAKSYTILREAIRMEKIQNIIK